MESARKVVSTDWGEMFIGTTGKQTSVTNVIREVTGATLADTEGCREDTLFTFLFDMCPYLIFVTGTTGGACVNFFCRV